MALYTKIKGPIGYTLIGSPTDNNGIISGFAAGKCAKTSENLDTTKDFELVVSAVVGTCSDNSFCTIFRNSNDSTQAGFSIGLVNYKFMYYLVNNEGTAITSGSTGSTTFTSGTSLLIKFEQKSTLIRLSFSMDNGATWTIDKSFNSSKRMGGANGVFFGGGKTSLSAQYWRGTIDLNETYINVDGTAWFGKSFSKVKVKSGLARYTVVGSPTITNGIASGFSTSNYLKIAIPSECQSDIKKSFEIQTKITMPDTLPTYSQFFYFPIKGTAAGLCYSSTRLIFNIYSDTYRIRSNTNIIQTNETLWIKGTIKNNIAELLTSSDGINWTSHGTLDITDMPTDFDTNDAKIGINGNKSSDWIFPGSIYLNETYIKINGNYFFRGSKQDILGYKVKYNNLFDGYYIIEDGKLKWANPNIFLQGDGNSYIDTGYIPNGLTEINFKYDGRNTNGWYFGGRTKFATNTYSFFNEDGIRFDYGQKGYIEYESGKYNFYNKGIFLTKVIGSNLHIKNIYDNNIKEGDTPLQTFNSPVSMYLFTLNNNGNSVSSGNIIINYFKLSENGNIIHHFVPVPKGLLIGNFIVPSNGMFDIVEQKFYENKGTGEFTIGGIPEDYIIDNGKLIWCRDDIYLESTGTQWIRTGIDIYQTTNHKLCFDFIPTEFYNYNSLFGVTSDDNDWEGWIYSNGQLAARYNNIRYASDIAITVNTRNYVEYIKNGSSLKRILNGTETATTSVTTSSRTGITIIYHSGPDYSKLKIFSFKLFTDTLQQYLVPVPKGMLIGDKIAPSNCMFDLVTQTFFENQGTGEFVYGGLNKDLINVGNNIVWTNENVYLQSNGTQYIDTNYMAKNTTGFYIDVQYTNTTDSVAIGSAVNLSTNNRFYVGQSGNGYYLSWNILGSERPTANTNRNIIMINYYNDRNRIYNTTTYSQCNGELASQNSNITLFGANISNNVSYKGKMKQYNVRITDNNILVRYFLPVNTNTIIGSFTVPSPGMWDAVTRKFYPNKGTGTFTYGKDS